VVFGGFEPGKGLVSRSAVASRGGGRQRLTVTWGNRSSAWPDSAERFGRSRFRLFERWAVAGSPPPRPIVSVSKRSAGMAVSPAAGRWFLGSWGAACGKAELLTFGPSTVTWLGGARAGPSSSRRGQAVVDLRSDGAAQAAPRGPESPAGNFGWASQVRWPRGSVGKSTVIPWGVQPAAGWAPSAVRCGDLRSCTCPAGGNMDDPRSIRLRGTFGPE